MKRYTQLRSKATTWPVFLMAIVLLSNVTFADKLTLKIRPVLTLEIAQEIAHACAARQIDNKGTPVSIAIFDQGANLILFHRMTGTTLGATAIAMEKGKSTANFPISTKQWETIIYNEKGPPGLAFAPNVSTITGGVPIMTSEGVHLGGVGVGGSSGNDDEACALAGIEAVKKYLKEYK